MFEATTFAKIADASQPGHGGRIGFVKSMSEGIVMPRDLRIRGFRPMRSRFDDVGETKARVEWLIERKPDCDFQSVRERGIKRGERSDAPNPYKLALGLLKHPNRQLSGAGDRGRSQRICFSGGPLLKATTFAKSADASQPGHGGVTGFVKSVSEGIVMPRDLRNRGFWPMRFRFDDAGETKASVERLIDGKPDCDSQSVRESDIKWGERSDAPNPYKLALGLLKHPNRQLSGAGDRGRSQIIMLKGESSFQGTRFAKIAEASQPGQGGRPETFGSMSEGSHSTSHESRRSASGNMFLAARSMR